MTDGETLAKRRFELIDFSNQLSSSYDELGGASPQALNVVIDPNGVVQRRPGISAYPAAPSSVVDAHGIIGLYAVDDGRLFAVGNNSLRRSIYKLTAGGAVSLTNGGTTELIGPNRPTFAETQTLLVIAGGSLIQKITLGNEASDRLGGTPPNSTHVAANSSRLLANDFTLDRTKVRFSGISQGSDITGYETWNVTGISSDGGFFTAEARPDDVVAVFENTNEIFVWGVDNVQVFTPDATNIFSPAATREFGTPAPYSIIKADQEFWWFDQNRRFISSDGRTFQNLEGPIKKRLDQLGTITDCFGYRVLTSYLDCLVWTFPTDGATFCYQKGGGWSEWTSYDPALGNYVPYIVTAHHLRRDGGINVVGTADGHVGMLDVGATSEFGKSIIAETRTGFLDRGSDNRKLCKSVKVSMRRATDVTGAVGELYYRDKLGPWTGPLTIGFSDSTDAGIVQEFRSLGIYNRRQWRFVFGGSAGLSLVRVQEEFETLGV